MIGAALKLLFRTYWKPLAAIAAAGVLFLTLKLYGQVQYERGRSDCERDHLMAELAAFRKEAERLTGLSVKLESAADELRAAEPKIIERMTRVEVQNPLPADCVIPADSLRIINDAIAAANAARQHGEAVPGNPAAGKQ